MQHCSPVEVWELWHLCISSMVVEKYNLKNQLPIHATPQLNGSSGSGILENGVYRKPFDSIKGEILTRCNIQTSKLLKNCGNCFFLFFNWGKMLTQYMRHVNVKLQLWTLMICSFEWKIHLFVNDVQFSQKLKSFSD